MKMLLLLSALFVLPAVAQLNESTRSAIDTAAGVKGAYTAEENVHRVSFPRADIKITIEDRPAHPFMGFGSWAAFTPDHGGTMVMGDIVLLEDEVSPAMSAALDNGLEVTALHNHFFFESPRVMYMHIGGSGEATKLAAAVKKVIDAQRAVRTASAQPARAFAGQPVPTDNRITSGPIDQILGVKGESNNGMYKATIGRTATHHGTRVGKAMGVNTWAAFAGTDQLASVDGDFAMTEDELQGVLKSLRKNGIHIVAIHNHMTHEQPRYVFLHYWGKGPAADLARAVRAAMDTQMK
jgi:hypothetical protein